MTQGKGELSRRPPRARNHFPVARPTRRAFLGRKIFFWISECCPAHRDALYHRFDIPAATIDELGAVAPVVGKFTLTNTGAALLLDGVVTSTLEMECTRCLSPTHQPVEAELEEAFDLITENTAYAQGEVKIIDENVEASVVEGTILNVGDLLRQSLLLAAPLQPLCAGGCTNGISVPEEELQPVVTSTPLAALGDLWAKRQQD